MISRADYPAWMEHGLCASVDPELWFPKKGGTCVQARAICSACPVRAQCLQDALEQETPPHGVWGGTTERERRPMRQAMRGAA